MAADTIPVSWATAAGRDRCLATLLERFPRADASTMTAEWWAANVIGHTSKLNLVCGDCHICVKPSIKNVLKGQGIGCLCGRWASLEGRVRCLALLEENSPEADVSVMTEAWWLANIEGKGSKLDITCRSCNSRVTPAIKNIASGHQGIGCGCSLRAPRGPRKRNRADEEESSHGVVEAESDSARGDVQALPNTNDEMAAAKGPCSTRWCDRRIEFLERLKAVHPHLDGTAMTQEWWTSNVTGCNSKMLLTCRKCSTATMSSTLQNIWKGQNISCLCGGKTEYCGAAGRERALLLLSTEVHARWDTLLMTEAWWAENVKTAHSKFLIRCKDCGYVNDRVNICDIRSGKRAGCFCTGGVPWSLEAGRQRLLALIAEHQPLVDATKMSPEWWLANIVNGNSKLHVTCGVCGFECENTRIDHFLQRKRFGCICNKGMACKEEAYRVWFLRFLGERQPQLDRWLRGARRSQWTLRPQCLHEAAR